MQMALEGVFKEPALKALVEKELRALAPGNHRLFCDGRRLYLRIARPTGKRAGDIGGASWIYRYMIGRKARAMGLGPYPAVTLSDAREKALKMRRLLLAGADPIAAGRAEKAKRKDDAANAKTLKECADAYIKAHVKEWKHPKTGQQWRATFATYVYPILGEDVLVSEIDTPMVLKVLNQPVKDAKGEVIGTLWNDKTPTAKRVRERIEAVLESARVKGYRHGDNPARWTGHLSHDLASPSSVSDVKNQPALPYPQIGEFMAKLRKLEPLSARGLEFLILTAVRSDVVAGATWSEIDLRAREWLIPAERMKGKKNKVSAHRVPLSPPAVAILEGMLRLAPKGEDGRPYPAALVFPGRDGKMSDATMRKTCKGLGYRESAADGGELVVPHGFRSTFRDWAGENGVEENKVLELALAHAQSGVEPSYARGDLFERRRKVMDAWGEACAQSARGLEDLLS